MFLEVYITISDPEKRYLDISGVTGKETVWHTEKDNLITKYVAPWLKMEGPNGDLTKLNNLGLVNATTGKPFKVLTKEEYNEQLVSQCIIL